MKSKISTPKKKKRAAKYEQKLAINTTFENLVKIVGTHKVKKDGKG